VNDDKGSNADSSRHRLTCLDGKNRLMLQALGYDWHPSLPQGRSPTSLPMDGGKPRLFIKKDSPASAPGHASEVVQRYLRAQGAAFEIKAAS